MTAYAIVTVTIENPASMAAYRERAGAALAAHRAEPLAVSKDPQIIEGTGNAPDVTVILTFPDRDHALAWIKDPAFQDVHRLRRGAGQSRIILI